MIRSHDEGCGLNRVEHRGTYYAIVGGWKTRPGCFACFEVARQCRKLSDASLHELQRLANAKGGSRLITQAVLDFWRAKYGG